METKYTHSAETRAKISESNRGRIISQITRDKISASKIGKLHSEEAKAKIGAASKGRIHTAETKAKISAIHKGKPKFFSDKHKENLRLSALARSKYNSDNGIEIILSEEHKAKISAANSGKVLSEETRAKISASRKEFFAKLRKVEC